MIYNLVFILRYEKHLDNARKSNIKKYKIDAITRGIQVFLYQALHALSTLITLYIVILSILKIAFWYAAKLIQSRILFIGNVYTVNV